VSASELSNKADIDCEEGRRLGCRTFCCRLLVRLDPGEMEPTSDGSPPKGFVDKNPDGNCIHFDMENQICKIWPKRPRVCREYECNTDFLLQVALRNGFTTLGRLVKEANAAYIPKETYIQVPVRTKDQKE
jgi:Fe-S-cluster containining protein